MSKLIERIASVRLRGQRHHLRIDLLRHLAVRPKNLLDDGIPARIEVVVFPIDPVVYMLLIERVPQVGGRGDAGNRAERIAAPPPGIGDIAQPFQERAGITARSETMAEDADLAIRIVAVEGD